MEYIRGTTKFQIGQPSVLSLGKFDGLHRGHESLLRHMFDKKNQGLKTVVFTFDIPPKKLVHEEDTKVLTTNAEKHHIFERIGMDYLIECPFTEEIMSMEPYDFIKKIVAELCAKCIVVGTDFHFGCKRAGDYRTLQQYAAEFGYEVLVVEKKQYEGRDISSTFVREEITCGNIEKANRLLGYSYFVQGTVEHGRHMGGPILGYPTVNLLPPVTKLLPQYGVYVTETTIGDRIYQGISNVGCKPTIEGENPPGVENHIFDFSRNVYGNQVRVEFLRRIREERKFNSIEELVVQMQEDIAAARAYFQENY